MKNKKQRVREREEESRGVKVCENMHTLIMFKKKIAYIDTYIKIKKYMKTTCNSLGFRHCCEQKQIKLEKKKLEMKFNEDKYSFLEFIY